MKKTINLIALLTLLFVSCSKDETPTNDNCGEVISKTETPNCNTGYSITVVINNDIVMATCVSETTYNNTQVGNEYCSNQF